MKKIVIIFLLFPFLLCAQSKPNIVFFFADDLGNGDISFNNTMFDTPNIDSLARNGAYFSRFYARAACTPSRYSLFTGKYAFRGSSNFDQYVQFPWENVGLSVDENTIWERLKEHGYYNIGVGKWHMGTATPDHMPVKHGFDKWFGINWGFTSMYGNPVLGVHGLMYNQEKVEHPQDSFVNDLFIDSTLVWLEEQAADTTSPFCLYFAFTNPHTDNEPAGAAADTIPYKAADFALAPGGYNTNEKMRWANIKNMDDVVGEIWAKVRALGIEENTIIIFTSDNGARTDSAAEGDNSPFTKAGKPTNAEGGIRVPFIWYHLNSVDSMTVDSVTCLEDILPTFIEGVLSDQLPQTDTLDGVNFYPLLSGTPIAQRSYIGTWIPDQMWCVIRGEYKLVNNITTASTIASATSTTADNIELYNVVTDEAESTDISGSNAAIVSALQSIIDAEDTPTRRTVIDAEPGGYVYPRWWGDPFLT